MYIYVYFFFFKEILDGQRSGDQLKRSRRKGRNRQEVPAFAEPWLSNGINNVELGKSIKRTKNIILDEAVR